MPRIPADGQQAVLAEALAAAETVQDVVERAQITASICGYLPKS